MIDEQKSQRLFYASFEYRVEECWITKDVRPQGDEER